jgi:hypothetical protein
MLPRDGSRKVEGEQAAISGPSRSGIGYFSAASAALEGPMLRTMTAVTALALAAGVAFAHHGWGSYDAAKPVTVAGAILTSKFENPHATITVRGDDMVWTVTLAPTSRMSSRGASAQVIAVGNKVSAYGYPSTANRDEMRAERITVDGKTYEMR